MNWKLLAAIPLFAAALPVKNEPLKIALMTAAFALIMYNAAAGIYRSVKSGKGYVFPKWQDFRLLLMALAGIAAILIIGYTRKEH